MKTLIAVKGPVPSAFSCRGQVFLAMHGLIGQDAGTVLRMVGMVEDEWHRRENRQVLGTSPSGWLRRYGVFSE
jgi:hypothetical protein